MNWFEVWLLTVVALFQLKHGLCSDSENEIPLTKDSPQTTTTPVSLKEDDPRANEVESTGQKGEIVTETPPTSTAKPDDKDKKGEEVTSPKPNEGDSSSSTNSTKSESSKNEGNEAHPTNSNSSSLEEPNKNKTEKEEKCKTCYSKPRPFVHMNQFGRALIIKNIDKATCKGWFEGTCLTLSEMLELHLPIWIRRYTFTWPNGRLSVTYYNYKGKLSSSEAKVFQKIYNYMAFIRKKVCLPPKNIWDQFKTALLGSRNSVMKNDDDEPRLFYGDRYPVRKNVTFNGKPETEVESHEIVYRFLFDWPGTRLTVSYYGKEREHGRSFVKKIRQIGNYTIDDINSKIIRYLVDDHYLFI